MLPDESRLAFVSASTCIRLKGLLQGCKRVSACCKGLRTCFMAVPRSTALCSSAQRMPRHLPRHLRHLGRSHICCNVSFVAASTGVTRHQEAKLRAWLCGQSDNPCCPPAGMYSPSAISLAQLAASSTGVLIFVFVCLDVVSVGPSLRPLQPVCGGGGAAVCRIRPW